MPSVIHGGDELTDLPEAHIVKEEGKKDGVWGFAPRKAFLSYALENFRKAPLKHGMKAAIAIDTRSQSKN